MAEDTKPAASPADDSAVSDAGLDTVAGGTAPTAPPTTTTTTNPTFGGFGGGSGGGGGASGSW
jgi:hypothetical protein